MSLRLYAVNEKAERGIEAVVFWVAEGKLALRVGDGYANQTILSIIWSSSKGTIRHWVRGSLDTFNPQSVKYFLCNVGQGQIVSWRELRDDVKRLCLGRDLPRAVFGVLVIV